MSNNCKEISWKDPTEYLPALVIMIMMPLTLSIYKGFIYGFLTYVLIKIAFGRYKEINVVSWFLALLFFLQILLF